MNRFFLRGCVLLVFLACITGQSYAADAPTFGPHPRLATTPQELVATMAAPGFAATREAAVKDADALLANPGTLPDGYGGWIFDYACPDDGTRLVPLSLTEHQCPACKKIYTDQKTIIAYRAVLQYGAEDAALKLGWAYAYTNDDKYVAGVKRVLLKLAHDYPSYPERIDRWGHTGFFAFLGGRRYVQSLDEAVGIIKLAKAYDLTYNSPAWSKDEKTLVEKDLFGPTADTLLRYNQDINNHQTWYNAGLMAIASVTGNANLVNKVLTIRGGFYDQLKRSIGSDGLWNEGSMAYHKYALQAMEDIVETGERLGLPLANQPKFRAMIEAPLHATYPDGFFPTINDSDLMSISTFNGDFEWAWKTYRDPIFAQAAAWNNPQKLAELLGKDAKPEWPLSTTSENLAAAGLAILRQGRGDQMACVFIDYGPHGGDSGGHGHYDKLNLMLFANGREWLLDPGRLSYSHKEYKTWVKETAAHNTVTLGGKSQQATTGKFLYMDKGDGWSAVATQSDAAYSGALLTRYLLLTDKMLVDVYDVKAPEKTQIDWLAHAVVPAVQPVENLGNGFAMSPGEANGYQHLTGSIMRQTSGDSCWDFVDKENDSNALRLRLWLANEPDEQIFTATGIGYTVDQKAPTLIRRRNTDSTRFVTVYDLSGHGDYVKGVQVNKANDLQITTTDGKWDVAFDNTDAKVTKH